MSLRSLKLSFPSPLTAWCSYFDVDLQSSSFKAKSLEQRGFGWKHGFELKFFFSIFSKLNQIKNNKAGVKCKPMWHCKYSVILESKVKFDKTYMKMSKYENSVFPYSVHSTVNYSALGRKTNITLGLFFVDSLRQVIPKEKFFSKLTKSVRYCQHPILWRNHQNWNLSFGNFLLIYEPSIKDTELHDMEQTVYRTFFYFYVLKQLSPKNFS